MNQGWQCPGCGRCYAPWWNRCIECQPKPVASIGTNVRIFPPGKCPEKDLHPPHEFQYSATPFWCDGRGRAAFEGSPGRCTARYATHDKDERCVLYSTHTIESLPHRFIFEGE